MKGDDDMGPYDTERETWAEPMPQAVQALLFPTSPHATKLRALLNECDHAAVELGDYDHRILTWLADWEPSTVQVVIGLVSRAYEAGRRSVLGQAVE